MTSKVCSTCKIEKTLNEFGNRSKVINGSKVMTKKCFCKACDYIKQKAYKEKNKLRLAERDSEYYLKNKESISSRNSQYVKNNREKRNAYIKTYKKERREKDPSFRIYESCRKRVWKILRKNKSNTTSELLGCSKLLYQMWLEFTFDDPINWSNYGSKWEIDHVVPIDSFNLQNQTELFKCFNWRNTRALNKLANSEKSNNIVQSFILKQKEQLEQFDKILNFKKDLKLAIRSRATSKDVEGSETRTSNLMVKTL